MVGEGVVSQYEDELLTQNAASIIPATNDGDFAPVLAIDGLSADKLGKDDTRLDDLTFAVGAGGVLAIAGVDGNGQEELFEVLSGLRPFGSNSFQLSGEPVDRLAPGSLSARRIAVIPPDRRRQGLALPLTTAENLTLEAARMPQFRIGPLLRRKALFELASRLRREFDVRSPSLRTPSALLSGGNQQKIVIARALWRRPKLLVAASPTRGLDVAATAYVHAKIRECTRAGTAVVLISTELDEIYALATRIAVLYAGRIVGIVGPDAPRETIGQMMGGSYSR